MNEETLFHEAPTRPAAERAAFLDQACAGRADLRAAVEAMLHAHDSFPDPFNLCATPAVTDQATPIPNVPPLTVSTDLYPASKAGVVIAHRYTLTEKLGEGGMGEVWVACQTEPVKRAVALKLIKSGMSGGAMLARFNHERQALALMDHPNIAKVLDGGMTPGGQPFFVMELVNGPALTRYCDQAKLTIRERLELFVPICQAVQHAHQKGIIHRDLKPSNILVPAYDGVPVPKVIDFGVAKATAGKLTDESMATQYGAVVGTVEYMSPEQAGTSTGDIDTRADIYSLGVLLYELLTGLRPIDARRLRQADPAERARILRDEEPARPSSRLGTADSLPTLAAARQAEPKRLVAILRGELDWIVMKCLEKDRNRRYETANALARDLQRYLADEPVEARPPSFGYRTSKFLRRHRGPALAVAVVLLTLVGGVIGTSIGLVRAELARRAEAEQREIAEEQKRIAQKAEDETLASYRDSTNDAIEQLIGSRPALGPQEREYLEKTLRRWQAFADRTADDGRSRRIRAEGMIRVAFIRRRLGQFEESEAGYRDAIGILQNRADEAPAAPLDRKLLAQAYHNLGAVLDSRVRLPEAAGSYRQAIDLQEKLVAEFPDEPDYQLGLARTHNNLGILLDRQHQQAEAVQQFQTVLAIRAKLADDFRDVASYRHDLANTHHALGNLYRRQNKLDLAAAQYHKAIDLQQQLADRFPTTPLYRMELARSQNNLGVVRDYQRRDEEAATTFAKGLATLIKLTGDLPAVPDYRQELAHTHNNLGLLLGRKGRADEAVGEYRKAMAVQQKLADEFPTVPVYRQELAMTLNNLGNLYRRENNLDEARRVLEKALAEQQKLADDLRAIPDYQVNLGGACCNYGNLLRTCGKPADSVKWYDRAIQTLTPIYQHDPRLRTPRVYLRNSHRARAQAHDELRQFANAAKDWGRAVELSPPSEQPRSRAGRALSLVRAGEVAEGVAEAAELTKSEDWSAEQWLDFARLYAVAARSTDAKTGYTDRAFELLQKAIKAGWKDAALLARDTDLAPLREREEFKKLLASLPK